MAITKRTQFILPLTAVIGLHLLPTIVLARTPNRADFDREEIPNMKDPSNDNDGTFIGLDLNIDERTARPDPLRSSFMRVNTSLFST
jgi:hypothetical protein